MGWVCLLLLGLSSILSPSPAPDSAEIYLVNRKPFEAADVLWRRLVNDTLSLDRNRAWQDALFAAGDSGRLRVEAFYRDRLWRGDSSAATLYLYGRCLPCSGGVRYFNSALAKKSCFAWAHNGKGACAYEAGDFEGAKTAFLSAIRCDPDLAEAYRNLAETYEVQKKRSKALAVYKKLFARRMTAGSRPFEWFGDLRLKAGEFREAAKAYDRAAALGRRGPALPAKAGFAWLKAGDPAKAEARYRSSVAAGNDTWEIYVNLASVEEANRSYEAALNHYRAAADRGARDIKIFYAMGNCAVMLGLYTRAVESYQQVLSLEPRNCDALFGLGNAYQIRRDYDSAALAWERVVTLDSNYLKAWFNLGSVYAYHVKDTARMRRYWNEVVRRFPKSEDAAFVKREMKKWE